MPGFCRHYGMEPTRNNAGISHENGSVEAGQAGHSTPRFPRYARKPI